MPIHFHRDVNSLLSQGEIDELVCVHDPIVEDQTRIFLCIYESVLEERLRICPMVYTTSTERFGCQLKVDNLLARLAIFALH